ncbi:hypothetical protein V7056_18220 [Bacillus sp. JJ664]
MPKRIILWSILVLMLLISIGVHQKVKYQRYLQNFKISLNSPKLGEIISDWNRNDHDYIIRDVQKISETDTAIVFVQVNRYEGYCKLVEGPNHKYQIKRCDYGSVGDENWFRSRKIKTNKGSFGVFQGENANGKIKMILISKREFRNESELQSKKNIQILVPKTPFFYFMEKIDNKLPIEDFYNVAYIDQNGRSIDFFR